MPRASRWLTGSAAFLTAGLLVLTGCGNSSSKNGSAPKQDESPATILAASFEKTTSSKTARMSMTMDIKASAQGASQNEHLTADGVLDFAQKQAQMTLHTPQGDGEERLLDQTVYVREPDAILKRAATAGSGARPANAPSPQKPWVQLQINRQGGIFGFSPNEGALDDPTQVLGYLQSVSDRVDKVGSDTVRGDSTTHYRAQLDLAKAAGKSGATPQQIAQIQQVVGSTLPVDVWVDDQGRVRRVTTQFPVGRAAGGNMQGTVTATQEFYDFGTDVNVTAPPKDQVARTVSVPTTKGGTTTG